MRIPTAPRDVPARVSFEALDIIAGRECEGRLWKYHMYDAVNLMRKDCRVTHAAWRWTRVDDARFPYTLVSSNLRPTSFFLTFCSCRGSRVPFISREKLKDGSHYQLIPFYNSSTDTYSRAVRSKFQGHTNPAGRKVASPTGEPG